MSKEVHVISENDLQGIKKAGKRIRALCPVHHSRDRDLSLNPYSPDGYLDEEEERLAGYGFCHSANCGATVLVQEWNPKAASYILGRPVQATDPQVKMTARELEQAEAWQRRELAALNKISSVMQRRLHEHPRALAYLQQRGLSQHLDLLASLEVGYIPPADEWSKSPPFELRAWCDRIVFPFTTAEGERGYVGRILQLWQPGMDENEHKKILNAHNKRIEEEHGKEEAHKYQVKRWRKTYRSGFFNKQAMQGQDRAVICEGPFDAISLIAAGLAGVIAVAGTTIDITGIPTDAVFDVILAYDADMEGKEALARTKELLGAAGVIPMFCPAPGDGLGKDWSERYRLHGIDGLAPLLEYDPLLPAYVPSEEEIAPPDLAKIIPFPAAVVARIEPIDSISEDDDNFCSQCRATVEHYEYDEASGRCIPYCGCCWVMRQLALALPGSQIERLDCSAQEYVAWRCNEIHATNELAKLAHIKQSSHCWYAKCKALATLDGWCEEHAAGREVMQLGEIYKFAALQINEALHIGQGVESWLGYAQVARPNRVLQIWRLVEKLLKKKQAQCK